MEQFFTSLSKRQTMLLLTSLAFGSSEAVAAYEHLLPDEEELLTHRAQQLLQIPREKRIPLLVQEIKRLVTQRRRQLASADARRLAELLKHERPGMVETVLKALPVELGQAVRATLGNGPPVRFKREVKPEVLSIIRWKLEDALKQTAPKFGSFRFTDLLTLQQRDVLAVADRMGARVLATAVAGLGEAARADFFGKLPPDQRNLAVRAGEAGASRRLSEKDAQLVMEIHGALENPSLGLRSAGIQRIVRAAVAQGPDFAQRMADRFASGDLGRLFARWLKDESKKAVKGDGGRMDIVEQLERLAQKGIIDRPMRLAPPVRGPPAPASAVPGPPVSRSAAPLARKSQGELPKVDAPVHRRDPVADREARRAGAMRQQPAYPGDSAHRPPKVLRDGKPLERKPAGDELVDTRPPRRSSSVVQQLPRRRDGRGKQ